MDNKTFKNIRKNMKNTQVVHARLIGVALRTLKRYETPGYKIPTVVKMYVKTLVEKTEQ